MKMKSVEKAMKVGLIGSDNERHLLGRALLSEINVESSDDEKSPQREVTAPVGEKRLMQGGPPGLEQLCPYYPLCRHGAMYCVLGHPFCQPQNVYCQCGHNASAQLHHNRVPPHAHGRPQINRRAPVRMASPPGLSPPRRDVFGEIHEKLERVLDGKEKVPRVEFIKAEASPLYECRMRYDGVVFSHRDTYPHRMQEARVKVAQQLLDYIATVKGFMTW